MSYPKQPGQDAEAHRNLAMKLLSAKKEARRQFARELLTWVLVDDLEMTGHLGPVALERLRKEAGE